MADPTKVIKGGLKAIQAASKAADEQLAAGKLKAALEAQQAPMTRPQGTGLPLMPRDYGMYTLREQKDLPRMPMVDKARAEGKSPKYNERMQDLLDSPKARKKVDNLINKGKDLNVQEWYGTEPLRQVTLDAGRTPEQFESMLAQLASASQRNPVDKQNQMGSYLYYLSETGQLPADSLLLTNKLKKALKEDPSLAQGRTLVELPKGYGSLAQGDIFNRAVMIGQGDIAGALPPNKKLGTFYENLLGNVKPVTVDVNALRGPIIEQGDPRWLTSKLVEKDETGKITNSYKPREMYDSGEMSMREAQQRPGFWEAAPSGSEYAGFEELWQRGAKRHSIEPAEAQALGWYGSADVTALKTKPENYVDNLERLIKHTAEQTGKSPSEVMNDMITGKGFLRKEGGAVKREESKEDMARFQKRFAMHKAIGGRVKKMAGGGRVSIFDAPAKRMASGGKASIFDKPVHMVDGGKIGRGLMSVFDKASKAADATLAGAKALPVAERDANLAKMLEKSKVKNKAYHATDQDVKRFDPKADKRTENKSNIAGWMTNDPEFANDFASQKFRYWKTRERPWEEDPNVPPGVNIMPVHLSIENPFYATDLIKNLSGELNMDEANAVAKALGVGVDELLGDIPKAIKYKSSGSEREHMPRGFDLVKSTVATDAMKRLGHDGVIAIENGSEVYAPFKETQIKSATGNRGTYDLGESDITKARGGLLHMDKGGNVKDKSWEERLFKKFEHLPKIGPPSPFSPLDVAYGLYKYKTGAFPIENWYSDLEFRTRPRQIDTGSVPVGTQFNSTDFDSNELNKKLEPVQSRAKGGAVGQESPADMARFKKRFAMHKAIGGAVKKPQKFDGGGIASPEESSGSPPDREQTKAGLMAEFLAKAAKDQGKEELSSLKKPRALTDLLNRGVLANNPLSAGVDLFNLGLNVVGAGSEKPFLGSEHMKDLMNKTGVTSGEERPMMETALSFASPAGMIKGAMKATDAAKKAPELIKKASDAFTSSKMSPLATGVKTATAGKPTGATYATKQEGPFFRVSPTTLDTSKAKTRGIREGDELQGPAPLGEGAGSTGRETPQLLSSEEVGRIIADPVANEPLNIAKKYTQETQGVDFGVPNIPESSLAKQSAIGRAQQLAVEGSPEYKTAVFDAYAKQMPDVLEQAGAKNYDDLMEKAYRQMAKETDDQFKVLPYNFSYHRAGEGNYNGAMDMASDVHGNKHLYVYQGGDKHDFLNRIDPASGLNENEKFRAVHDLLGHAIYGNQFGPKGEEMAWAVHSQMYSPLARLAMTAETRGQNSMVNYSPLNANLKAELAKYDNMANEARRKGDETLLSKINAAKRQAYAGFEFAPNKAVLLPPEFLDPKFAGGMPAYLQAANRPAKGTETQSVLTHFSNDPNLQSTDPRRYGTGIKGAEGERLRDYAGGVRDRSYFYMGEPGTVSPESGLGVNRYRGEASSLYDITQDPLNFQKLARESNRTPFTAKVNQGVTYPLQDANDIERLVKEYGYQGMANPKATKPTAIMFKETPVRRQARGGLTLMR